MSLVVGPGVDAMGTNRIASLCTALIAFLVYLRKGHVDWKSSIWFTVTIAFGALFGAITAQWMPKTVFPWLLLATCPLILALVLKRELWTARALHPGSASLTAVVISGIAVGFYDGVWGPGGGTLMFLALLFFARLPLLTALAASKLANITSATVGVITYGIAGHVHVHPGLMLASGMTIGGFFGASLATTDAARVVRPTLVVVVALLVIRVVTTFT
jgi:uncharacterized membrane protein YfcA